MLGSDHKNFTPCLLANLIECREIMDPAKDYPLLPDIIPPLPFLSLNVIYLAKVMVWSEGLAELFDR